MRKLEIMTVKIKDRETGLYKTTGERFTTRGKIYTNIGHAKLSVQSIDPMVAAKCDFIIQTNYGTKIIPVASYLYGYLEKEVERYSKYPDCASKTFVNNSFEFIKKYCKVNGIDTVMDLNNKLPETLPCPFCAGKALDLRCSADKYGVMCNDCHATIIKPTREEAIIAWNKRVR